jgi:hypothetical protein
MKSRGRFPTEETWLANPIGSGGKRCAATPVHPAGSSLGSDVFPVPFAGHYKVAAILSL